MRLVKTGEIEPIANDTSRPPSGYIRRRAYRELHQLLYRVLQLNAILNEKCTLDEENPFDSEKALDLKRKIRHVQKKLEQLYAEIEREEAKHAASSA